MLQSTTMETVALENQDFLDSHPDRAEVAIAHIVKQSATAFYIVKTGTPDGREWAVSKRFSAFVDLRKELCNAASNPEAKKVEAIPFPPKKMFGGAERAVVKERKDGLNTWMKAVMPICPGDRHLAMFLAQDGSVAPPLLEKIGLGNQRKGMDGSQDATKVALSMDDYAKPSDAKEDLSDTKDFMAMARDMEQKQKDEKEVEQTLSLADRLAQDHNAPSVDVKQAAAAGGSGAAAAGGALGGGDGGADAAAGGATGDEDDLDAIMNRFMGTGVDASMEVGGGGGAAAHEPKITVADADYAALSGVDVDASVEADGFSLDEEEYAR